MPPRVSRRKEATANLPPRIGSKRWILQNPVRVLNELEKTKKADDERNQLFAERKAQSKHRVDYIRRQLKRLDISTKQENVLRREMHNQLELIKGLERLQSYPEEKRELVYQLNKRKKLAKSPLGKTIRMIARPSILTRGPRIIRSMTTSNQRRIVRGKNGRLSTIRKVE